MEPNATYDDLCNTITDAINAILHGLLLEAQQKYAYQVQVERQARKAAESAAAQPAEPEAAMAELTGKEAPHA